LRRGIDRSDRGRNDRLVGGGTAAFALVHDGPNETVA
jgi:hypothetical protein